MVIIIYTIIPIIIPAAGTCETAVIFVNDDAGSSSQGEIDVIQIQSRGRNHGMGPGGVCISVVFTMPGIILTIRVIVHRVITRPPGFPYCLILRISIVCKGITGINIVTYIIEIFVITAVDPHLAVVTVSGHKLPVHAA